MTFYVVCVWAFDATGEGPWALSMGAVFGGTLGRGSRRRRSRLGLEVRSGAVPGRGVPGAVRGSLDLQGAGSELRIRSKKLLVFDKAQSALARRKGLWRKP